MSSTNTNTNNIGNENVFIDADSTRYPFGSASKLISGLLLLSLASNTNPNITNSSNNDSAILSLNETTGSGIIIIIYHLSFYIIIIIIIIIIIVNVIDVIVLIVIIIFSIRLDWS